MMSEHDFIEWLRGFVTASGHYNLTPQAWEELKQKLSQVYTNEVLDILRNPDTFKIPQYPVYPQYPTLPRPTFPPWHVGDPPNWLSTPYWTNITLTATNSEYNVK